MNETIYKHNTYTINIHKLNDDNKSLKANKKTTKQKQQTNTQHNIKQHNINTHQQQQHKQHRNQ